jgi:cobaltochelatase CobN
MYEVTARLLEAIYRGMWDADEETEEKLKELFEDLEGDIEGLNDR